jgi:hypothetical protein
MGPGLFDLEVQDTLWVHDIWIMRRAEKGLPRQTETTLFSPHQRHA